MFPYYCEWEARALHCLANMRLEEKTIRHRGLLIFLSLNGITLFRTDAHAA